MSVLSVFGATVAIGFLGWIAWSLNRIAEEFHDYNRRMKRGGKGEQ